MRDMIVESYNEATHYIVRSPDRHHQRPGASDAELDVWFEKRNAVNRYYAALG
jgi:hypothetical protein